MGIRLSIQGIKSKNLSLRKSITKYKDRIEDMVNYY